MLASLLLALNLFVSAQEPPTSISDFRGGLNTRVSSVLLNDNESPATENMLFDETGGATTRDGFTKLNQTAIGDGDDDVNGAFSYEQEDGDKYCLAFSSTTGYFSQDDCATFTAFVSTLTRNNDVNCISFNNNAYCVNDQYNFKFNGTADSPVSGMPSDLDFLVSHRNYCFGAGTDTNPSRLYWSGLGNCDSWTTSTDFLDINAGDGDVIVGLGPPIFDVGPIVYKKYSTWAIEGSKPSTWKLINLSKTIGGWKHRAIANFGNKQCFDSTGPNGGQIGIYCHNITSFEEASAKIRSEIETLANFRASFGRESIDSFADWSAGTFDTYAASVNREPGALQSSRTVITDTLAGDWAAGSLTNLSTSVVDGALVMVQASSGTFINAGCESNSTTINWETNQWDVSSDAAFYGSMGWGNVGVNDCPANFEMRVLDYADNVILNNDITLTESMGVTEYTIDTSTLAYPMIKVYFRWVRDIGGEVIAKSKAFIRPSSIKVKVRDGTVTRCYPQFDIDESSMTLNADFVSSNKDMYISTPIWGLFTVDMTSAAINGSTGSAAFQVRVSTAGDGGGYDAYVTPTIGSELANAQKRNLQYKIRFEVASTTVPSAQVRQVSEAASSTWTWRSPELFLNNGLSTWGQFQTLQSVSGAEASLAYCIRIATYTGQAQNVPCLSVTPGVAISHSTGAYIIVQATGTIGVDTETAKVEIIVINYNIGTEARSTSLAVFKNRLHYSGQTSTAPFANVIYSMDTGGAWSKWTGVVPRHLNTIGQNFVMASSSETTQGGFLYKLYDSDEDNGAPINAFWETKDFGGGALQNVKSVSKLYTLSRNDNNTLDLTLKADSGLATSTATVSTSCDSPADFCIKRTNFEPPINGNTYRMRYQSSAGPWELRGVGIEYKDLGPMGP